MSDQPTEDGAGMSSVSTLQIYVTLVILSVVGLVGVIGNALVIFVYAQKNDKQTATLFILILAVLDFTTCLVMIPFTIFLEVAMWRLGVDFLCKAYFVLNSSNTIFGSLIISAIAVDRYLCICHPFSRLMTVPRARGMVICLVLISILLGCPPLAAVGVVKKSTANGSSEFYCIDTAFVNTNSTTPIQKFISSIGHQTQSTTYLLCILSVTVLYVLIYLSVYRVRKKRQTLKGIRMKSVHASSRGHHKDDGETARQQRWWRKRKEKMNDPPKQATKACNSEALKNKPQAVEIEVCDQASEERQPLAPDVLDGVTKSVEDGHRISLSYDKETGETSAPPPYPGNGTMSKAKTEVKATSNLPNNEEPQQGQVIGTQPGRRISIRFIKDTQVFQNFRTAAMLFIVAIVYILTFLPASLMSYKLLSLNLPIFYLYFLNNAANPIIYSFMNQNFREDIHALVARLRSSATGQQVHRNHTNRPKMTMTVSVFGNR